MLAAVDTSAARLWYDAPGWVPTRRHATQAYGQAGSGPAPVVRASQKGGSRPLLCCPRTASKPVPWRDSPAQALHAAPQRPHGSPPAPGVPAGADRRPVGLQHPVSVRTCGRSARRLPQRLAHSPLCADRSTWSRASSASLRWLGTQPQPPSTGLRSGRRKLALRRTTQAWAEAGVGRRALARFKAPSWIALRRTAAWRRSGGSAEGAPIGTQLGGAADHLLPWPSRPQQTCGAC